MLANSCDREQWLLCSHPSWGIPGSGHGGGGKRGWEGTILTESDLCLFFFSSYIGNRVISNMVIIEVSLLSGFIMTSRSRMLVRTLE